MSRTASICVASLAVLLEVLVSSPPETVAVLVTEDAASVVLPCVPTATARTSIEKVQLLPARIVAPARLMLLTLGVITPGSQLPVMLSGFAIIRPAGMLSLKLTPVRSVATLGLLIVNVSVTLLFNPTVGALKDFAIVGGDCA